MESVTVIIPTYKPGEYLLDCLKSLESQTLDKKLFKVLIVLNGDKEPYYSLIEKWLDGLNCQTELIYTFEKGVSNARNLALDSVTSSYIAFIDDDDYVSPHYLESLLECAESSPIGTIACSDVRTFDINNKFGRDYISRAYTFAVDNSEKKSLVSRRSFLSSSCCKLIPTALIGKRRFNAKVRIGEDALFMATISDMIKAIVPASSDAIYYRRLRPNSASRRKEPFCDRIKRKSSLISIYLSIYFSAFPKYNSIFFITRILAIIKG